ncbi:14702_t:CDS:2, partial [Entrophospora sp. SA101]
PISSPDWDKTSDLGLLATILVTHLKKLSLFGYSTKQNTIEESKEIYLQYEENEILQIHQEEHDKMSEVDKYLSEDPWI